MKELTLFFIIIVIFHNPFKSVNRVNKYVKDITAGFLTL